MSHHLRKRVARRSRPKSIRRPIPGGPSKRDVVKIARKQPQADVTISLGETVDSLISIYPGIISNPPSGHYQVKNLFVDPSNGRLTVEYDDTGSLPVGVGSNPPPGKYLVTNLYVDSATGNTVVEYDDIPT